MKHFRYLIYFVALLLLTSLACGPLGGDEEPTPQAEDQSSGPETVPTAEPTLEPSPTPLQAVSNLQDLRSAVIQIEAEGTFIDPQEGMVFNAAGRGSGFIIDESGIAVTNNHVVTGAAILRVFVAGETSPRNARVLGASECSDLAVIDIDGEGFPYLQWYDAPLDVGLDVYAAGFPLGDPEFTLTRGIISKASADGESGWASVDKVVEHDATINPGNSGGPLVTPDGLLVGVNYAGQSATNQYFAIARDEALPIIEQLRQGQDVTSIGVNGTAVNDGEGLSGIWVASVKTGSPADLTGVEPGDIILSLESLILATDGTMADYCDILRTRTADTPMRIEILRYATQQVLEGSLNGEPLVVSVDFGQQLADEVPDAGTGGTQASYSYMFVSDDSGLLQVEVPEQWPDIDGSAWTGDDGTSFGYAVRAAPDLGGFLGGWDVPGVFFGASKELRESSEEELLDAFDYSNGCTYGGREPYSDPLYTGFYDVWQDCGDSGSVVIVVSAVPEERSFIIVVIVQAVTDPDLDALDRILDSFQVVE